VDVVGHDYKAVEFVVAFPAVVLESLDEELGVGCYLEEPSAAVGLGGDEESAVACCSGGDGHGLPKGHLKVLLWQEGFEGAWL
jgi:hypothetical protein